MTKHSYEYSIYIGRFQPIHYGHLKSIKMALNTAEKLIIIVGSFRSSPSLKNPWTAEERKKMILNSINKKDKKRISFIFLRDRFYHEDFWKKNLLHEVKTHTHNSKSVCIIGHEKDQTSYYLRIFPQFPFIETGNYKNINATDFRTTYFFDKKTDYSAIPKALISFLKNFKSSKRFLRIKDDYILEKQEMNHATINLFSNSNIKELVYSTFLFIYGPYIAIIKKKNKPFKNNFTLPIQLTEKNPETQKINVKKLLEQNNIDLHISEKNEKAQGNELSINVKHALLFDSKNHLSAYPYQIYICNIESTNSPNIIIKNSVEKLEWMLIDDLHYLEEKMIKDMNQVIKCALNFL